MNCPHCGAPNVFGVTQCEYCGSTLPEFPNDESKPASELEAHRLGIDIPKTPAKKPDHAADFFDAVTSMFTGGCFSCLGWIFCFPLMLSLIAAKRETSFWRGFWWVIAFLGWVLYLGMWIGVLRDDSPNPYILNSTGISEITAVAAPKSTAIVEIEDPERAELIRKSCALRFSNRRTLSISDPNRCPLLVRFAETGHAQTVRVVLSEGDRLTVIPLILDYIRDLSDREPDSGTLAEFADLMRGNGTLAYEGENRFGLKIFRLNCFDKSEGQCRMSITIQKPK